MLTAAPDRLRITHKTTILCDLERPAVIRERKAWAGSGCKNIRRKRSLSTWFGHRSKIILCLLRRARC